MVIQLLLPPDQHAELEQRAIALGTDLATFVQRLVQQTLDTCPESAPDELPDEQWRAEFRTWVASHRSRNPHFDDSRESVYP